MNCSGGGETHEPNGELILFVSIGQTPFQDSVNAVDLAGRDLEQFLAPSRGRSYVYVSGNSLQDILAVSVHEVASTGEVVDHLFMYHPRRNAWRRLVNMEGMEGAGFLSPDRSRVAFIFAPPTQPPQLRLWVLDLKTGERAKLTGDDTEEGMWDGYASWRPDGQEIVFLRMRRAPGGLTSKLMRVPASGGQPTEVLDTGEDVVAACFGPDGDRLVILTVRGFEVFDIATKERKLILPWSMMNNAQYQAGGLIWSKEHDTIAFAVLNRQSKRHELWVMRGDGSNPKVIYSQDESEGRIIVTSFVRP